MLFKKLRADGSYSTTEQALVDDDNKLVVTGISGGGGGGGSGTEYTEDAALPANPAGGVLVARRRDTLTAVEVSTDGDAIALNATSKGELRTSDADAATLLTNISSKLPTQVGGKQPVLSSNITTRFRDAFEDYTPGVDWTQTLGSGDFIALDGNAAAASYLVISKDPLTAGTESAVESIATFAMPLEASIGLSLSQRALGQEFAVEMIDTQAPLADIPDIAISAISQTTTVLTIDTATDHGLSVGKSIGVRDCSNPLANYPSLVVASCPTPRQITCTAGPGGTIPSQTITNPAGAKGSIYFRERLGRSQNGTSQIFENATVTNASIYLRSEAGDALPSGTIAGSHTVNVASTASVQLVNSAFQYAFAPTTEYKLAMQADRTQWADVPVDSTVQTTSRAMRTQVCPDPTVTYKLRFRAVNNKALTVPSAQIVSATKSGTTTGTIVTATPHGLALGDPVVIYGIRAQGATEFPNLLVATAVASVVDATTFTIVIGTAGTVTSYGGFVAKVQGGNLGSALGYNAVVAQAAVLTTLTNGVRQLVLTGNTTWASLSIGDHVNLVGVRDNSTGAPVGVDGVWKVANLVTTALTLVPGPGNTPPADFGSINCGGGVIRRTELRISYVRVFDYERERVEILARPTSDIGGAVPVAVQNSPAVTVSSGTVTTVSAANLNFPQTIADVASAALTGTATTVAITPTFGSSYQVNVPVTAVSGTTPTLDVGIEESDDSGTNWFRVYDFPRITAAGMYRSPKLPLTGNRVRYVQTVAGTSPSFTRAVNRLQGSDTLNPVRQLVDRSITHTTLNSTTPSLNVQGVRGGVQLVLNLGAATTPPALQLEGSDDNGASWYALGTPLTGAANSTVQATVAGVSPQLIRARVSTAGATVTAGYTALKAF